LTAFEIREEETDRSVKELADSGEDSASFISDDLPSRELSFCWRFTFAACGKAKERVAKAAIEKDDEKEDSSVNIAIYLLWQIPLALQQNFRQLQRWGKKMLIRKEHQ
jgi:hypothetical protein